MAIAPPCGLTPVIGWIYLPPSPEEGLQGEGVPAVDQRAAGGGEGIEQTGGAAVLLAFDVDESRLSIDAMGGGNA